MVRRCLTVLFSLLLLLGLTAAVRADAPFFTGYEELMGYLGSQRPAETDLRCSEELYETLCRDDFRELLRLLARTGIDQDRAEISYNDLMHFISLGKLEYSSRPWAECLTLSDVSRVFREYVPSSSDLVLLCSGEVLSGLLDGQLAVITAQNGIRSYSFSYSRAAGILTLTSPVYYDVPYANVSDYARFSRVTSDFAARGIRDFIIVFDPDLLARITGSPEEMTIMLAGSKVQAYSGTYDLASGVFRYSDVTYTDMPREICRSAGDAEDAIRRMGSAGIREFELIFPHRADFEKIAENDFALLFELEGRAGMSSTDLSYDRNSGRLIFRNAEITADAAMFSTPAEAIAYTEEMVTAGRQDIHLFCSPDLYDFLLRSGTSGSAGPEPLNRIYDLVTEAGIFAYDITLSDAVRVISIHINALFPGKKILQAARSGDRSSLSERETQTLLKASEVAAAASAPDPLQRAKFIHDWICSHVVYTVDESTDEDDTAVGAILSGQANCDGYSDAFYLIGSLAGLSVRYQHGDSLDKGSLNMLSSVSHLWNLLEIGGVWHMVDVTWDDEENGWTYIWFNVGRDIAERMHCWNEDMTVPIAETTDRIVYSDREFYVRDRTGLTEALDLAERRHLSDFYILFEDPAAAGLADEAKQSVSERICNTTLTWSRNEKMGLMGFYDLKW